MGWSRSLGQQGQRRLSPKVEFFVKKAVGAADVTGSLLIVIGAILTGMLVYVLVEFDRLLDDTHETTSRLHKTINIMLGIDAGVCFVFLVGVGIGILAVAHGNAAKLSDPSNFANPGEMDAEAEAGLKNVATIKIGGGILMILLGLYFVGSFSYLFVEFDKLKSKAKKEDETLKIAKDFVIFFISVGCLMTVLGFVGVAPI